MCIRDKSCPVICAACKRWFLLLLFQPGQEDQGRNTVERQSPCRAGKHKPEGRQLSVRAGLLYTSYQGEDRDQSQGTTLSEGSLGCWL